STPYGVPSGLKIVALTPKPEAFVLRTPPHVTLGRLSGNPTCQLHPDNNRRYPTSRFLSTCHSYRFIPAVYVDFSAPYSLSAALFRQNRATPSAPARSSGNHQNTVHS
ncbi:uncharacterized protein N7515_002128, partial [Penicillium bovifimosum]